MKDLFIKFIKFGIVGGFGTVIDFAVTAILMIMFGLGEYLSKSIEAVFSNGIDNVVMVVLFVNFIGFVVAATSNYFFNRVWTFSSKNPDVSNEYTRFFLVSLVGLGINLWVIYLWNANLNVNYAFWDMSITNFWVSKIAATFVVMLWNFFANYYFTFGKARNLENQ